MALRPSFLDPRSPVDTDTCVFVFFFWCEQREAIGGGVGGRKCVSSCCSLSLTFDSAH